MSRLTHESNAPNRCATGSCAEERRGDVDFGWVRAWVVVRGLLLGGIFRYYFVRVGMYSQTFRWRTILKAEDLDLPRLRRLRGAKAAKSRRVVRAQLSDY